MDSSSSHSVGGIKYLLLCIRYGGVPYSFDTSGLAKHLHLNLVIVVARRGDVQFLRGSFIG